MKDFRRLQVWQKGHNLTLECYAATARFPREEMYGLTAQIRRCSASFPANIAKGCGKETDPEFGRFLQISSGSLRELEYQLLLARDLGYLTPLKHSGLQAAVNELQRMLGSLVRRVYGSKSVSSKANG